MAGSTFGFSVVDTIGGSIQVSADGRGEFKTAGVTIDWATVTAISGSDVTYADGVVVKVGEKALRYGQVIARITTPANDTLTLDCTGGTFTLTVVANGVTATTTAITASASLPTAATVQAALVALSNVGTGNAVVSGSAGGPFTIGFAASLGTTVLTATSSLTGGASTAVVTIGSTYGNIGEYGPVDFAATDGRQTLANGYTFIVNETIREDSVASNHPPVLEGGKVFLDRVIQSGTGTHSLAAGPTLAELLAVMPRLRLVRD